MGGRVGDGVLVGAVPGSRGWCRAGDGLRPLRELPIQAAIRSGTYVIFLFYYFIPFFFFFFFYWLLARLDKFACG